MKVTETITVKPTKGFTKTVTKTICDMCGKTEASSRCQDCKRDICHKYKKCYMSVDNGSDYNDDYCILCYELRFVKYADKIKSIEKQYEDAIEEMDRQISVESLSMEPLRD